METPIKKQRALPRVWARFWRLKVGDTFFVPGMGGCATKKGFFSYTYLTSCFVERAYTRPWRRVKTTVFIRDARPGGKSSYPLSGAHTSRLSDRTNVRTPSEVFEHGMGSSMKRERGSPGHEGTPYRGSVGLCAPGLEQTGPSA